MDKNTWYVVNVVWYDGVDAYVSKFILQIEKVLRDGYVYLDPTRDSKRRLEDYLTGNGEVLKYDALYEVDLDNIVAFKSYEKSELRSEKELFAAYDRFKRMWF